MADNLQITEGTGGKNVRTIEKPASSGIHIGLTAIDIGAGTTETRLVAGQAAASGSVPVVLASDQASVTNISTGADAVAAPTVAINVASFTLLRNRTDNDFDRATVAAADALAVTGVLASAGMMWNGTGYDRPRGDTTNGLDVDVTRVSGNVTVVNGGTFATQVDGAALTALQLIDDPVATTGSAVPAKAMFVGGTDGTNARALKTDSSGELQVDVLTLPALAAGSASIGKVIQEAAASGGATPYKLNSAATTNATSLKGSAGTVYMIAAFNTNAAVRYLKFYNKASSPTVGTDTPILVLAIPGNTAGGGFTITPPTGINFSTGIAFALTTGAADSNTGAVAADEILVNIAYA